MNQGHHPPRSTSTLPGLLLAALVVGAIGCTPILDTDDLTSSEIGDAEAGEALFVQKTCVSCHAYDGQGGDDAPPLDYMRDRLSARQLANMSGTIWNHLPGMLTFFNEEGIPVPTFAGNDMADLLAYLHGGPPSEVGTGRSGTHVGGRNMPSDALGSALLGQQVYTAKRCGDCHSYDGTGGDDGGSLDYMTGHLSATEVANMAGNIWNHVPLMVNHFEEEGIPYPLFVGDEMADVIAYLHGGRAM